MVTHLPSPHRLDVADGAVAEPNERPSGARKATDLHQSTRRPVTTSARSAPTPLPTAATCCLHRALIGSPPTRRTPRLDVDSGPQPTERPPIVHHPDSHPLAVTNARAVVHGNQQVDDTVPTSAANPTGKPATLPATHGRASTEDVT